MEARTQLLRTRAVARVVHRHLSGTLAPANIAITKNISHMNPCINLLRYHHARQGYEQACRKRCTSRKQGQRVWTKALAACAMLLQVLPRSLIKMGRSLSLSWAMGIWILKNPGPPPTLRFLSKEKGNNHVGD